MDLFGTKYIDGKPERGAPTNLIEEVIPLFLEDDRRTIVISGNKGAGKSTLMQHFERKQWEKYQKGHSNYIPIYLALKGIEKPSKCIEEFIDEINDDEEKDYDEDEKKDKDLRRFKKDLLIDKSNEDNETEFVILLDEYDELP